jgi:hypothetical protein
MKGIVKSRSKETIGVFGLKGWKSASKKKYRNYPK